jgi:hypothetical protein
MNNTWETLVFLTWLKVSHNSVLIKLKDKVQAIGIALPANKATLIVGCVVQFHIQGSKCDVLPLHAAISYGASKDTCKRSKANEYF